MCFSCFVFHGVPTNLDGVYVGLPWDRVRPAPEQPDGLRELLERIWPNVPFDFGPQSNAVPLD